MAAVTPLFFTVRLLFSFRSVTRTFGLIRITALWPQYLQQKLDLPEVLYTSRIVDLVHSCLIVSM